MEFTHNKKRYIKKERGLHKANPSSPILKHFYSDSPIISSLRPFSQEPPLWELLFLQLHLLLSLIL